MSEPAPKPAPAAYVNEAIPFELIGNRHFLPAFALVKNPALGEFIGLFGEVLEYDPARDGWWLDTGIVMAQGGGGEAPASIRGEAHGN